MNIPANARQRSNVSLSHVFGIAGTVKLWYLLHPFSSAPPLQSSIPSQTCDSHIHCELGHWYWPAPQRDVPETKKERVNPLHRRPAMPALQRVGLKQEKEPVNPLHHRPAVPALQRDLPETRKGMSQASTSQTSRTSPATGCV